MVATFTTPRRHRWKVRCSRGRAHWLCAKLVAPWWGRKEEKESGQWSEEGGMENGRAGEGRRKEKWEAGRRERWMGQGKTEW